MSTMSRSTEKVEGTSESEVRPQRALAHSLAALFPSLAAEWHPTENGHLTPADVTTGSHRRVWWRCARDAHHEWVATVANRAYSGTGCPECLGRKLTPSTSLAARFPAIAEQWHPVRNGALKPDQVFPGSTIAVWWKCPNGIDHEWQSNPNRRTNPDAEGGCPFCSGHRLSVTHTLAARCPEVAAKWHPTLNGSLRPDAVAWQANRKVWWKCARGPDHEWAAPIANMTRRNGNCPFCSSRRVSVTNCLSTKYPSVAAEWHPDLNGAISPDQVAAKSNRMAWWKCQFGHVWKATIQHRTDRSQGCPVCARPRRRRVATTSRRRTRVHLPSFEGLKAGPVVNKRPR